MNGMKCLVLLAAVTVPACVGRSARVDAAQARIEINTPPTTDPVSLALSPDGQQLVFVASVDDDSRLWLRRLTATEAQPLAGTEGASHPFWSPDNRSLGFFADGKLKRLDISGGRSQTLADGVMPRGGTWNQEGVILFARSTRGPLFRIAASGGEATLAAESENQPGHWYPQFLPDGRQYLAFALGRPGTRGVDLVSLDTGERKRLTSSDTNGLYIPSGWLLWQRAGTLMAQRLDLERKALVGNPITLADSVALASFGGAFSVSATGEVAYRTGAPDRRQLAWFDRTGKALGIWGPPDENAMVAPRLSPDDRRVAIYRTTGDNVVEGNADIWLMDETHVSRFTSDPDRDREPMWSPDGSRILFDSRRKGVRNLYVKPANGTANEELILESAQDKHPTHWSPDGQFIMYQSSSPQTAMDLWVLPLEGNRTPWVFVNTNAAEQQGEFSPDGRWVAYMSNESGRSEVYVRPFVKPAPAAGAASGVTLRVSTAGGIVPHWAPGGKELYYIAPDETLMAAPITMRGATIEFGTPVALFQPRIFGGGTLSGQGRNYDTTRDGRFLINIVMAKTGATPITILQNWKPSAP